MMHPVDFKVRRDRHGFYVVAYRINHGVEQRFETCPALGQLLNLTAKDVAYFLADRFGGEEEVKDRKVHFASFAAAAACRDGLRDLIPLAVKTGNLFLTS